MPPADSDRLQRFLADGVAPIVFTLGSTAVTHPGNFYRAAASATRTLGKRAILLGAPAGFVPSDKDILTLAYAPYRQVFPKASVIVHQGGSGTTGQALLAGRPMLFVPYGWDQPDNGARVERLGAGLTLERTRRTPETMAAALTRLQNEPSFTKNAAHARDTLLREHALKDACESIERLLGRIAARPGTEIHTGRHPLSESRTNPVNLM